ncbi:MAG: MBL fold metallo-hydrolase [Verrucomicrobiota bacterium]
MLEVTVLASGSSGNALLARSGDCSVLVDAGLSARRLATGLQACGVAPGSLSGILLTHEHGDHTKGLKVFVEKFDVPVFANPLTADHLKRQGIAARWNLFSSGSEFFLENIGVLPFSVPHDAADPVGFVLRSNGIGFAVLTDLGYATRQVVESVRGVHALLIETNHDEALLQGDTKRPWSVKQRILSRHGHLSNSAAAEIVAEVATEALRHVLLGHLSRDCNSPELAVQAVGARLRGGGASSVQIQCARVDEESPMLSLVI